MTQICLLRQSLVKYLQRGKEIQLNWTRLQSFEGFLRVFLLLLTKFSFWKGDLAPGYVTTKKS